MSKEMDAIKQALHDGVLAGVREAAAETFNVYRTSKREQGQQERSGNGLIEIAASAKDMLDLIDEVVTNGRA